ncbi:MAG TPA: iron ABC transporter permease [Phycisphaerales bacterium]|nr:iron ABC transporter permease [Phycisphaerales bacterium]
MKRAVVVLIILVAVLVAVSVMRLLASGTGGFSWTDSSAFLSIRFSRLFSGLAVGAALGGAGVILQTLLRNPLASPDVVGVSSGASLGVMLNLYLSTRNVIGVSLATSAAWQFVPAAAGAAAVLAVLVATAGWTVFGGRGRAATGSPAEPVTLLLTGVVISILCGAAVMFLQYLLPDAGWGTARLLMGSLSDDYPWEWTAAAAAFVAVALAVAAAAGPTLDALALPNDEAVSVGVDVPRVRIVALVATGVLTAVAVVIAGPVGFVGLVAPHAARIMLGPAGGGSRHAILLPAAAIAGGTVIVAADTLVRTISPGAGRMPLGVLTALLGGPALIILLRKEARGRT